MATIINNRSNLATDPIRNFRFLVTFTPHNVSGLNLALDGGKGFSTTVGFTSVSGLAVTTDSIPYREGGYNTTVHQLPGQSQFSPVTFQRGVVLGSRQNWDWMRTLFATVNGGSTTKPVNVDFRCDIEIAVLAHPIAGENAGITVDGTPYPTDSVAMRFKVYNAWPTSIAYSDLNAGDNALLVEQMTLVHEGWDVNWGTQAADGTFTNAASF
jgi:phage tail-like protein